MIILFVYFFVYINIFITRVFSQTNVSNVPGSLQRT